MAFVRCKTVDGKRYYQMVRNRREGGKHLQEVLDHLGHNSSLEAAIEDARNRADAHQRSEAYWLERAENEEADIIARYGDVLGGKLPRPLTKEIRRQNDEWPTRREVKERLPELRGLWASDGGPLKEGDFMPWMLRLNQIHYHRFWQEAYQAKLAKRLRLQKEYPRLREPNHDA